MSLGIKPLDGDYLTHIFDELAKLEVQLDSDPLVYGPKRLNQKVALVRKMATQCERMFLDAAQKHAHYKRSQRAADLVLDMAMKHLLANDPEVRAGRAVSEREAIASGKLKTEVQDVAAAKQAIEDLEAVINVIKAKRSDLRDIQGRLRDQMRLCQEEIGLGNRWGSKSPRGVELQPGQGHVTGDDLSEIDEVIAAVRQVDNDAETHLEAEVDTSDTEAEEEAALVAGVIAPDADPLQGFDDDEALLTAFEDDDVEPASAPKPKPKPASKPAPTSKPVLKPAPEPKSVPVPELAPAVAVSPEVIPGDKLVSEFGFVPHCSACGEVQSRTFGGMVCPNGHGGVESVPPVADDLDEVTSSQSETLLPGTAFQEEITAFLAGSVDPVPAPKKTRFQIEEEDGLDLLSILEKFV